MWVCTDRVGRRRLVGHLHNTPAFIPRLYPGQKIKFTRDHIIDVWYEGDETATVIEDEVPHVAGQLMHPECN